MKKKSDKDWNVCVFCKHRKDCVAGSNRILGLAPNSPIVYEIGCFNYETYKNQKATQMKLFDI